MPCEAVYNLHPAVKRTALVGVGERGSQRPVICVELEQEGDRKTLEREILDLGRAHRTPARSPSCCSIRGGRPRRAAGCFARMTVDLVHEEQGPVRLPGPTASRSIHQREYPPPALRVDQAPAS
ncbi:MAG: hypothetical protein HY815_05060 [Candidatus Riflebacteria bacterium]|nr:hypothetical protein [Candidatus Riflebacteria bacterium]